MNRKGTTMADKTGSSMEVATIRIEGDEAERLRVLAKEEDRSVSSVIRLAVRDYLRQTDRG